MEPHKNTSNGEHKNAPELTKTNTVTVKGFAQRMACDKTTVERAITSGYLEDAVVEIEGHTRIHVERARANWAKNFRDTGNATPALRAALGIETAQAKETSVKETAAPAVVTKPGSGTPPNHSDAQIAKMSRAEAERTKAAYAAACAKLDYLQKVGELIDKTVVEAALFSFGQIIRNSLEGLPARLVDAIRAADSRQTALHQADQVIKKDLTWLADLEAGDVKLKGGRG